jgi:hypothetical protein
VEDILIAGLGSLEMNFGSIAENIGMSFGLEG